MGPGLSGVDGVRESWPVRCGIMGSVQLFRSSPAPPLLFSLPNPCVHDHMLQAVPDCSSLEAQMFMAMVDINNDSRLTQQVSPVNQPASCCPPPRKQAPRAPYTSPPHCCRYLPNHFPSPLLSPSLTLNSLTHHHQLPPCLPPSSGAAERLVRLPRDRQRAVWRRGRGAAPQAGGGHGSDGADDAQQGGAALCRPAGSGSPEGRLRHVPGKGEAVLAVQLCHGSRLPLK